MRTHSVFRYAFLALLVIGAVFLVYAIAHVAAADNGKKPVRVEVKQDRDSGVESAKRERSDSPRVEPKREPVRVDRPPVREEPKREPVRIEQPPVREEPKREPVRVDRPPVREEPKREPVRIEQPPVREEPKRDPVRIEQPPAREEPRRDPVRIEQPPAREEPKRDPPQVDRSPVREQPKREPPRIDPSQGRRDPVRSNDGARSEPRRENVQVDRTSPGNREAAPDKRERPGAGPTPPSGIGNGRPSVEVGPGGRPGNPSGIDLTPRGGEKREYPVYVDRTPSGPSAKDRDAAAWRPRKPDRPSGQGSSHREYDVVRKYPIDRRYSQAHYGVERQCGPPGYFYSWRPHWRPTVVWSFFFYYGSYCYDPYPDWVFFAYPGWYYRTPYYWYRCSPGYCYWSPVIVIEHVVRWPSNEYYLYDGAPGETVDDAIRDIQDTWYYGDVEKLSRRLTSDQNIRVYFDNEYAYSMPSQDYYEMTLDAIGTTTTERLEFDVIKNLPDRMVFLAGRHVFRDADDQQQTVYVSFTLKKSAGRWRIVAVGTSENPIAQEPYRW